MSDPTIDDMTVADVIADTLHRAGVRTVFGMPGGEVVEVLDAIRRQGISFEMVHHETSAVFMADATARLAGVPGVVLTTLGPGASNAVAGVAHAHLDRSPLLVITAQKPDDLLPNYTHQVLDLHALFAPITKRSMKITAENAPSVVEEALALAMSGRPGPVHLQVSNEEAARQIAGSAKRVGATDKDIERRHSIDRADPDRRQEKLDRARQLLEGAKRPLILAGLGLEPEAPYVALRRLAETLDAPVVTTPKAKGALPDDHALSAGTVGLTRTDPVYEIIDAADCIVAVGFDAVELVKPWKHQAPLIWVASWPNQDPVLPAAVELIGSIAPGLDHLAEAGAHMTKDWGAGRVEQFRQMLADRTLPMPAAGRLLPQTVLGTMRRHLPRQALLAVDVGSHKIFGSLAWQTLHPNRFLVSNGLSCMGSALPGAMAAAMVLDGQPAACLIGDGGLLMCEGELSVLARLDLPVLVVVLVDGAIDLIRSHQVRRGKLVYGTEFPPPDFVAIAAGHGIHSTRVDSDDTLDQILREAIASRRPALVEVPVDPAGYPTTPDQSVS